MREKRFFVAFTAFSKPGEAQQELCYGPRSVATPHCLHVALSSEEEAQGWIRDLAWQEQRSLGQHMKVSHIVSKTVRALRR